MSITQGEVGTTYHVGIGTTDGAGLLTIYGYMLKEGTSLVRKSDLQARSTLIASSPNLSDRDLVKNPRISDGDFSGGGLQQIFINPKKYWDSDMEIRTPGALTARPAWYRTTKAPAAARGAGNPQGVVFQNDVWVTFNETNGNIYNSTASTAPSGVAVSLIDSDGVVLYAAQGAVISTYNGAAWSTLFTAVGTITQMWAVNLGTAGRFLYFVVAGVLYRYDLVAALGTGDPVPVGNLAAVVVDVVPYGGAIAILLNDNTAGSGFSVWYHDGLNMQLVLRLTGYTGSGMCSVLGNLWITANPIGGGDSPILAQIGGGTFDIVAQLGAPPNDHSHAGNCTLGAPRGAGQFVNFTVKNPTIVGIAPASYVAVYDVLNQTISHMGNFDGTDNPGSTPRSLICIGRAVFAPQILSTNGVVQYQGNQSIWSPNGAYQANSQLLSSRIDFNTPGIGKLFRRVVVHHSDLNAGESITVKGFVNADPLDYPALSTATSPTNTTVGSTTTTMIFPQHTTGFSMYFALIVGSTATTSPSILYVSTEISVPWTWEMTLDCTTKRRTLESQDDPQGLLGKDLYLLLKNAWESAQQMTYWDGDGSAYTVEIQEFTHTSPSPQAGRATPLKAADFEGYVSLTLSESVI